MLRSAWNRSPRGVVHSLPLFKLIRIFCIYNTFSQNHNLSLKQTTPLPIHTNINPLTTKPHPYYRDPSHRLYPFSNLLWNVTSKYFSCMLLLLPALVFFSRFHFLSPCSFCLALVCTLAFSININNLFGISAHVLCRHKLKRRNNGFPCLLPLSPAIHWPKNTQYATAASCCRCCCRPSSPPQLLGRHEPCRVAY